MGGPQMLGQDSGQKIQNTCLLIACHKSTLTKVRFMVDNSRGFFVGDK